MYVSFLPFSDAACPFCAYKQGKFQLNNVKHHSMKQKYKVEKYLKAS